MKVVSHGRSWEWGPRYGSWSVPLPHSFASKEAFSRGCVKLHSTKNRKMQPVKLPAAVAAGAAHLRGVEIGKGHLRIDEQWGLQDPGLLPLPGPQFPQLAEEAGDNPRFSKSG